MKNSRECISYNKNLLTGEVKSEIKSKNNTGIKGKIMVSLYDAITGEKTKEAYTENLIPDLYFKDTFIGHFVNGIMGVGNTRTCNNHNWFNYLYLTDSDKPEHVNEQRVEGNIIGYAHRNEPYSGNDVQRGTINRAETRFEITDSKIKVNFVFDFPTHAANGVTESLYFCEADPANKDYFYSGPSITGRETADNDYAISASTNPSRYFGIYMGFAYARVAQFLTLSKGYMTIDCKNTSFIQSSYIQFPDSLKGHWIYIPFDINVNDFLLWEQAVKLLNADGNPLVAISSDPVKKYDGLQYISPYRTSSTDYILIGFNTYDVNESGQYNKYLRIYRWSKVGVLLSQEDINLTQGFKDTDYNLLFNTVIIDGNNIYTDGCIDIVGYIQSKNEQFNEQVYSSYWGKINIDGDIVQRMSIKPKIGNCTWFGTKGMNSGNIERRCYVSNFRRTKTKVYAYYSGSQGGTGFWQCISLGGNLIEPYRSNFGINGGSYITHNLLDSDRWIARYSNSYSNYCQFFVLNVLTSRPIGTHTRLTRPVEKTEANTMKVQYMLEVDLLVYGEDYY